MKHFLTSHFNKLRQNTLPPAHRMEAAKELPGKVREFLEKHETYWTLSPHSRLAGSYAQKTCVGDVKDVDFLVRIDGTPEGDEMTSPWKTISELAKALEGLPEYLGYAKESITIETARRSVHVHFKDEDFHLDVVPCIAEHGFDQPLWVPCKNAGKWVNSDPLGYIRKLNEINKENGYNVKPLSRLLKHFVQYQMTYMRPKSYWLGALLLQIIDEKGFDSSKTQAELFNWLVTEIHAKYRILLDTSTTKTPSVKDPMLGHDISWNWERNAFETFMKRLAEARDWSDKALQDGITQEKAIEYWQKIFGDKFPTTIDEETVTLSAMASAPLGSAVTPAGRVISASSAASVAAVVAPVTRFHGGK